MSPEGMQVGDLGDTSPFEIRNGPIKNERTAFAKHKRSSPIFRNSGKPDKRFSKDR